MLLWHRSTRKMAALWYGRCWEKLWMVRESSSLWGEEFSPSGLNPDHQISPRQKGLSNEWEHLLHTWLRPSLKTAELEGKFKPKRLQVKGIQRGKPDTQGPAVTDRNQRPGQTFPPGNSSVAWQRPRVFPVPFPPLSPSHSPVDNPPCDLHFCGSVCVLVVCLVCFCFCFKCGC